MSQDKKINWFRELGIAWKTFLKGAWKFAQVLLNVLITVLLIVVLTGIIVASAFSIYIKNYVNTEVDISLFQLNISSTTTRIYRYEFTDRANRIGEAVEMEEERLYGTNNSIYVSYDKIPEDMIEAVIAIEDKRFKTHDGVDWKRTIAAGANFFLGFADSGYGGSTITQQLIKNITQYDDYKIQRKIQEIFWALDLETKMDKEEILELYLNIINLGSGCYGVQAAANEYFSKDVSELTLIECAAIASITNNPSYYNPITHPDHNAYRRDTVLEEMLDQGLITQREFDESYEQELVLNLSKDEQEININSWYVDMAIEDVIDDLVNKTGMTEQMASLKVYNGGLNIYILVDPKIQNILETAYLNDANFPANKSGLPAQSSSIVIDPETGDILGVVGSRDEKTANRVQNYATQTVRSPGSSIKPLSVYAPAIESGVVNYATVYDDTPYNFGANNKTAWPNNATFVFRGLTNINYAVTQSLNTIAVKVLNDLSLEKSFRFCHDTLHMSSLIELKTLADGTRLTDKDYAALSLGQLNYGLTVREITAAYSIFVNNGVYNKPNSYYKVTDSNGDTVLQNDYEGTIAVSEETASLMTIMLQNVVKHGTASAVTLDDKYGIDVAGKTGTAGESYDRWFIGYTPYYICGVWYGYEYPKSLAELKYNPCINVWDAVMEQAHQSQLNAVSAGTETLKKFEVSENIVQCTYCVDSGKLITDACKLDPRGSRAETGYFIKGTEPTAECDCHIIVDYDNVTKAIACEYCPKENIIPVSLIKVNRSFPIEIYITDAQYTYMELPFNVRPYSNQYYAYYYYLSSNTVKFGRSRGSSVFNRACYTHFDVADWQRKVAEIIAGQQTTPSGLRASSPALAINDLYEWLRRRID